MATTQLEHRQHVRKPIEASVDHGGSTVAGSNGQSLEPQVESGQLTAAPPGTDPSKAVVDLGAPGPDGPGVVT